MKFTQDDYQKAIEALKTGLDQLEPDGRNCAICGDTDHQAFECHHNPLVWGEQCSILHDLLDTSIKSCDGMISAFSEMRDINTVKDKMIGKAADGLFEAVSDLSKSSAGVG